MTDLNALSLEIKASGMKLCSICDKAGIPYSTLYRKLRGHGSFTPGEIVGISDALNFTKAKRDTIFLSEKLND